MKAVYNLNVDLDYSNLFGMFVAEEEDVDYLIKNELPVYFGEVCGKYSEVECTLDETDIIKVSNKQDLVDIVLKNNLEYGYNPFDEAIGNFDEDDEDEDDIPPYYSVMEYIQYKRDNIKPED